MIEKTQGGHIMFQAVCFDFDYTLGDSTDSIVAGYRHGLKELGWPEPDRESIRATIGYLLEDGYTILTGDDDPEHRARFRPLFLEAALERQRRETTLFPGAEELIRGLKSKGVKVAIVSTKRGDTIQVIMERFGLMEDLELIVGSADVSRHKPDPEGLLLAMDKLGVTPEETLFCGDTVLDAGAAQNAGCPFAAVLNGTTPAEAFDSYPTRHISPDLYDLARWLEV